MYILAIALFIVREGDKPSAAGVALKRYTSDFQTNDRPAIRATRVPRWDCRFSLLTTETVIV